VVATRDGSTVDAMTAKASAPPTPTTSSIAPLPSTTAPEPEPDAAPPPVDAGETFTPEAGYEIPDGF
jgi:hypothetical protein